MDSVRGGSLDKEPRVGGQDLVAEAEEMQLLADRRS